MVISVRIISRMVLGYSQLERLCLSSSGRRFLRKCSPHRHPESWLIINVAVLIWSIRLVIYIVGTRNDNNENDEKTSVELEYLIYNFGTCTIWAFEVGLNIFDYIDTKEDGFKSSLLQKPDESVTDASQTKPLWIEFTVAVYFVFDSASVVSDLTRNEIHKLSKGMLVDVLINMLAYFYIVYRQFSDWRKPILEQTEQTVVDREIV